MESSGSQTGHRVLLTGKDSPLHTGSNKFKHTKLGNMPHFMISKSLEISTIKLHTAEFIDYPRTDKIELSELLKMEKLN